MLKPIMSGKNLNRTGTKKSSVGVMAKSESPVSVLC
jgi:hypothetical protein